jgi:hypothetical protein
MKLFGVAPMSDAEATKWSEIRARGRRRFILIRGVLGWGVLTAILLSIVGHVFLQGPAPFLGRLAISLALFPVGGIYVGTHSWSAGERRYFAWRRQHAGQEGT